jgi:hypothetical protein
MEVSQANVALHLFADQTELAEIGIAFGQITQRNFKHTAFQGIGSDF